jgi:group I intron endonuclease
MKSGVYCFRSFATQKVYVGSSSNVKNRIQSHKYCFKKGNHGNNTVREHVQEYGISDIYFSILEYCDENELNEKENYWINLLKATHPNLGFNIKAVNNNTMMLGNKPKQSNSYHHKRKPVYRIDKVTGVCELIQLNNLSLKEKKIIYACAQYWRNYSKNCYKSYKGYIYVSEKTYDPLFDYVNYKRVAEPRIKKEKIKKEPIPYSERNITRVSITATCLVSKQETTYKSITECCDILKLKRNKVDLVLSRPYQSRSHRGYYLKRN